MSMDKLLAILEKKRKRAAAVAALETAPPTSPEQHEQPVTSKDSRQSLGSPITDDGSIEEPTSHSPPRTQKRPRSVTFVSPTNSDLPEKRARTEQDDNREPTTSGEDVAITTMRPATRSDTRKGKKGKKGLDVRAVEGDTTVDPTLGDATTSAAASKKKKQAAAAAKTSKTAATKMKEVVTATAAKSSTIVSQVVDTTDDLDLHGARRSRREGKPTNRRLGISL